VATCLGYSCPDKGESWNRQSRLVQQPQLGGSQKTAPSELNIRFTRENFFNATYDFREVKLGSRSGKIWGPAEGSNCLFWTDSMDRVAERRNYRVQKEKGAKKGKKETLSRAQSDGNVLREYCGLGGQTYVPMGSPKENTKRCFKEVVSSLSGGGYFPEMLFHRTMRAQYGSYTLVDG